MINRPKPLAQPKGMKNIITNTSPHQLVSLSPCDLPDTNTDSFVTEHFDHVVEETPTGDRNDMTLEYANQYNMTPKMKRSRTGNKPKRLVLFSYSPHPNHRTQNFMTIARVFTQTILPNKVSQRIINVYAFVNKSTAMAHCDGNIVYFNYNSSIIYNYHFCDKHTGERLYCIADKKWSSNNKHYHYQMRNALFTQQDIEQMGVECVFLPPSSRYSYERVLHEKEAFERRLQSCLEDIIGAVKWNRVRVFNASLSGNKQHRAQFNTKRRIIKMNTSVFVDLITQFVRQLRHITLIPIIMFVHDRQHCAYRVEFVQIVRIENDTDIGISYCYDDDNAIKVAGIHVNKWQMMDQHQLIAPNHHCDCLDGFESRIDDIQLGNPDDDLNRLKDMRHRMESKDVTIQQLQRKVRDLQTQLDSNNTPIQKKAPNSNVIQMSWSQFLKMYPISSIPAVPQTSYIYGQQSGLGVGWPIPLQQMSSIGTIPPPPPMIGTNSCIGTLSYPICLLSNTL
eukprot:703059_1